MAEWRKIRYRSSEAVARQRLVTQIRDAVDRLAPVSEPRRPPDGPPAGLAVPDQRRGHRPPKPNVPAD